MAGLVKGIAGGVGLLSEAITASKTPASPRQSQASTIKSPDPTSNTLPKSEIKVSTANENTSTAEPQQSGLMSAEDSESDDDNRDHLEDEDRDETYWELDEVIDDPIEDITNDESDEQLLASFFSDHPITANQNNSPGRLPLPVILPQRRPGSRKRGFIRAYAPVLEECGIDQAMFLHFLKTFHRMSQSSPWLPVVRIAALGLFALPIHSIGTVGNLIIQGLVSRAQEIQRRSRTNSFLDKMNDSFFAPRGLYCLVMKCDLNASESNPSTPIDINVTIAEERVSPPTGFAGMKQNFRNASGTSREIELPESAPLVFTGLDTVDDEDLLKQTWFKSARKFSADYFDRRSQAHFHHKFPESSLSVEPTKTFNSRYSDPSHPANNGTLLGLLSGGKIDLPAAIARGREKRQERREERIERIQRKRPDKQIPRESRKQRKQRKPRKIKANILYLMIVNLPTAEELEEVRALSN